MSASTTYTIVADTAVNVDAVAAVQAVPLVWEPYTGPDAWGSGDAVRLNPGIRPPTFSETQVYWGVTGDQFYVGELNGVTWDEAACVAALQSASGVTVTAE